MKINKILLTIFIFSCFSLFSGYLLNNRKEPKFSDLYEYLPCTKCIQKNEIINDPTKHFTCPHDKTQNCMECSIGADQSGCKKGCFRAVTKGAHEKCWVSRNNIPLIIKKNDKPVIIVNPIEIDPTKIIETSTNKRNVDNI